ncbi:hypothetical protein C7446_2554 [Kushneria sinocarnis]|uniref:Uncharacterized protein n=1 Tax=Kushneria sinocarnis TaxID=595502 RepID=A0A420WUM9_9GAMM|nr:hypothetical protein [Kushneria sinocarnis]RKQ97134.1 hypothetical protein C7446_2554 [Kushneria sinocarnis]
MIESADRDQLNQEVRRLRRANKAYMVIAAVCLGIASASYLVGTKLTNRAWESNVSLMAANAQLFGMVQYQSEVAGIESGSAKHWKQKAEHAQAKWGGWKSRAQKLERRVCEQQKVISSYQGATWQSQIPCEGE